MTNDEIKLKIAGHLSTHSYEVGGNILPLVDLVQSLVAQAYEEAAQVVEQANITSGIRPKFPIRGGGPYTAIRTQVGHSKAQLAASIRALRDSLVEPVPSR